MPTDTTTASVPQETLDALIVRYNDALYHADFEARTKKHLRFLKWMREVGKLES